MAAAHAPPGRRPGLGLEASRPLASGPMGDGLMLAFVVVVVVAALGLVARAVLADRRTTGGPATASVPPDRSPARPATARARRSPDDEAPVLVPPPRPAAGDVEPARLTAGQPRPAGPDAGGPGAAPDRVIGPAVAREPVPDPEPATLAELLRNVQLPHGLVPTTPSPPADSDRYWVLSTAEAPPDEVGSALADELERHGYRLHSLSDDEAVARRGPDLLSLRLHPDAARARAGGGPLFPGAGPGTVGLEVWVGAGPEPRPR